MVQRVADELWHGLCPGLELLPVRAVAGHILLVHAVGTHLAPLVMVAAQPYLCDGVKLAVLIDFLRIDVAVIVKYRHILCKIMIQRLGHIS